MRGAIKGKGDQTTYWLEGRQVNKAEFDAVFPEKLESGGEYSPPGASLISFKPMPSDALGVHPKQRAEAEALAKFRGVPTEFGADGRPIFTSSRHFREYAKKHGFRHMGY